MRVKNYSVAVVKFWSQRFQKTAWTEYRLNPGRSLASFINHLRSSAEFRFCVIYKIDQHSKERQYQTGYFDKSKDDVSNV